MNIRSFIIISVCSILILLLAVQPLKSSIITYAQSQTKDIAELFNLAAQEHKWRLDDLMRNRGITEPIYFPEISSDNVLPNISSESIAKALAAKSTTQNYFARTPYQEKTAVLFYSYNDKALQTWLVDEQGIQAYHRRMITQEQLNYAVDSLRRSLGVDTLQFCGFFIRSSVRVVLSDRGANLSIDDAICHLTEILLPPPVANKLVTVKHLIVVPTQILGTVPYALLKPFENQSYLIDKMSISMAPSLYDIGVKISSWDVKIAFSSPLIVGNPFLPENPEWNVPPLPGAEREAKAVAKVMNSVPLIGKKATKEAVTSRASESSLLYFATHGVADLDTPLGGLIMLSAQTLEEGWWTAKEIQALRLRAEIAVLSACQTGLGGIHDAGIIGISRAFQIAGVPRVVMSLWNVDDEATSELMQAFIRHLKSDIPSEALRQAMVETREDYPSPSKWASFVLFGTPR